MSCTVYVEDAPGSETALPASAFPLRYPLTPARLRDLDYLLEEQDKGNVR